MGSIYAVVCAMMEPLNAFPCFPMNAPAVPVPLVYLMYRLNLSRVAPYKILTPLNGIGDLIVLNAMGAIGRSPCYANASY